MESIIFIRKRSCGRYDEFLDRIVHFLHNEGEAYCIGNIKSADKIVKDLKERKNMNCFVSDMFESAFLLKKIALQ